MTYKQLFLLIITIWSAHICTRFVFDNVIPKKLEYRTVYMLTEEDQNGEYRFHGKDLDDFGSKGWEMVNVVPGRSKDEVICFFKRQTVIKH